MKLDADEKELLESVERGEWKSRGGWRANAASHSYRWSEDLTYCLVAIDVGGSRRCTRCGRRTRC